MSFNHLVNMLDQMLKNSEDIRKKTESLFEVLTNNWPISAKCNRL